MTIGFRRYAVFAVPEGAFFAAGSTWLGWNSETGQATSHPNVPGLNEDAEGLTETPRKYGFHGTIKPPFVLADGTSAEELASAAKALAHELQPVSVPRLVVRRLGGFVACVPNGPVETLSNLAARMVVGLDRFRAPPSEAELARRRKAGLSARQEELLVAWGYPYVMDEFRFHLTLSGKLPEEKADALCDCLARYFAPVLPTPYDIRSLGLLGEDAEGRFHLIRRYALSG